MDKQLVYWYNAILLKVKEGGGGEEEGEEKNSDTSNNMDESQKHNYVQKKARQKRDTQHHFIHTAQEQMDLICGARNWKKCLPMEGRNYLEWVKGYFEGSTMVLYLE